MTDTPFTEQILKLFRGRMDAFVRDHGRPILPETVASKPADDRVFYPVPVYQAGTIAEIKEDYGKFANWNAEGPVIVHTSARQGGKTVELDAVKKAAEALRSMPSHLRKIYFTKNALGFRTCRKTGIAVAPAAWFGRLRETIERAVDVQKEAGDRQAFSFPFGAIEFVLQLSALPAAHPDSETVTRLEFETAMYYTDACHGVCPPEVEG